MVNYTTFPCLSYPSSLLYAVKKKLLPLWIVCEFTGWCHTSWSREQAVSQGFELLMAKILANIKASLGLSLVLAEVNTDSSHPSCQGQQQGQLGWVSCEILVGSWDTCGACLALASVCVKKGELEGSVLMDALIHLSHSHNVSSAFRLVPLKVEFFSLPLTGKKHL